MDTFALSTHPLPSCTCSAAPWWMSHTREGRRNSGFFHICFSYQAGKLQRGSDLSWLHQYWPPSSREKEKLRAFNSNSSSIFYPKHQPKSSLSVLCNLSLVLRTPLSLWSHPTPSITVLHSFCSACTSHSGERTCFKTALKTALNTAETFPHTCHFVVG